MVESARISLQQSRIHDFIAGYTFCKWPTVPAGISLNGAVCCGFLNGKYMAPPGNEAATVTRLKKRIMPLQNRKMYRHELNRVNIKV